MSKRIFLSLIIVMAIIISLPYINFQDSLSQGDHGRDLYASVAVYRGELPYKDFWWVYGPLMPYYYGIFNFILGTKISSILVGKLLLKLVGGVLFFLAASVLMRPWLAFIAACWFLLAQMDFFFTYNHIGGMVMTLGVMWAGLSYLKTNKISYAWATLAFIAVLGLIKINFALSAGVAFGLALILNWITNPIARTQALTTPYKILYATGIIGIPLWWLATYSFFLNGLTIAEIRQCLPYLGGDQPYNYPPSVTIPYYFNQHWLTIVHQWLNVQQLFTALSQQANLISQQNFMILLIAGILNLCLHPIWHLSTLSSFIINFRLDIDGERRRLFWVSAVFLIGFFVLNFHEFVVSGVWYRSFWAQPQLVLFHFLTVSTVTMLLPKILRGVLVSAFVVLIAFGLFAQYQTITAKKTSSQILAMPRGNIYVGNEPAWVDTVTQVNNYLTTTVKKDELFFALPYDTIYYYLAGKKTPTRQLIFFDHIKIPREQEEAVIRELEKNKTAYVVMSNRVASTETGLGVFGQTYCPLIYQYIMQNFAPVYKYGGNWQAEPGWANNHGVIVFKRK